MSQFISTPHKYTRANDIVIIYMTPQCMRAVTLEPGTRINGKWGSAKVDDCIGKEYGRKINTPTGYFWILPPTPDLWTSNLPHRTQIIYQPDIDYIIAELYLTPGMTCIEAGTGSASLTHHLARTVSTNGKIFTFEFHPQRAEQAAQEFIDHQLKDAPVTLEHRDVCKDGFGDLSGCADAVFLDMPAPWDAIPNVPRTLKKDTMSRICCFSPCIEQVQKTILALKEHQFTDIKMIEVLDRSHNYKSMKVDDIESMLIDPSSYYYRKKKVRQNHASAKLEASIERKAAAQNKDLKRKALDESEPSSMRPKARFAPQDAATADSMIVDENSSHLIPDEGPSAERTAAAKGFRKEMAFQGGASSISATSICIPLPEYESSKSLIDLQAEEAAQIPSSSHLISYPPANIRGHTSYLTFASFVPWPETNKIEQDV